MGDAPEDELEQFNPFTGLTSRLIGTVPDWRCLVYKQLTQWNDIRNMAKALARPQLQDELYACIEEIDFANGAGLTTRFKNWLRERPSNYSQKAYEELYNTIRGFETIRDKLRGLRYYRLPWIYLRLFSYSSGVKAEYIQFYERIIADPLARFVGIHFYDLAIAKNPISFGVSANREQEIRDQEVKWVYEALSIRLEKWGVKFCITGDIVNLVPRSSICWVDGMICIDTSLLYDLHNYMVGSNFSALTANRLIINNLHVADLQYIEDLRRARFICDLDRVFKNLQEITFDMCGPKRYIISIGSQVHTINAFFSIIFFILTPVRYFEWCEALYRTWNKNGSIYLQVKRFEIPIPKEKLKNWQYLFPNVPPGSFQFITAEQIKRFNKLTDTIAALKKDKRSLKVLYEEKLDNLQSRNSSFLSDEENDPLEIQANLEATKKSLANVEKILQELNEWDQRSLTLDELNYAVEYFNSQHFQHSKSLQISEDDETPETL